ncbi:hypothetical protein CH262_25795 [Rhodococcus sp. 05-2255-1e]|uniref:hypothetical protein n=1 Tax=Rhodococcus sp. 05-2255-1e TaxID=2022495 RepID=UPI000B9AF192|nr:hypothetical protein [Rhodococcus sp. 05-2255-1e]OZE17673.1 hypothetical protein CH262_25795 [Rhodococcus sp. 05-2255-1e]
MKEIYGVLQLAAALVLFRYVDPYLAKLTDGYGDVGEIAKNLVNILISAAAVYFVTGRIFARPRIRIDWVQDRVETSGPEAQLAYPAANHGRIQVFELKLRCEGNSLVAWALRALCERNGALASVRLAPSQRAFLVDEMTGNQHNTASVVASSEVRFQMNRLETDVDSSWIEVSLEAQPGCASLVQVKCEYDFTIYGLWPWLSHRLMPISSPVKKFELRRV